MVEAVVAETGLEDHGARDYLMRLRFIMIDGEHRTEPQLMGMLGVTSATPRSLLRTRATGL